MDLRDLALFVHVVESGSMTAAARRSGLSQPSVSRAVQRLEREVGTELLRRTPSGTLEVLPAGWQVAKTARGILAAWQQMRDELAPADQIHGTITIAASTIPAEYLVPPMLSAFRKKHPQVTTRVLVADTAQVFAALARRDVDAGFVGAQPPSRFISIPVGTDSVVLAVTADHPFAARGSVPFAEVLGQPLVQREEGSGTHAALQQALTERGVALPAGNITVVGSTQAQLAAIRAGVGIGFVSSFALENVSGVTVVRVDELTISRTLYLAYEAERPRFAALEAFIHFVKHED